MSLKVRPGSSREEVVRGPDGDLKVYIRQAPADGKSQQGAYRGFVRILQG